MRANRHVVIVGIALAAFLPASRAQNDAASQKEPAPPPSVTVIGARDAHGVLGRDVRSAADENMGRIVDVIVDRGGQVRAAVIDFGGFLGVRQPQNRGGLERAAFRTHRQQARQHYA